MCSKHGTDFLEYKCRYCCSVAVFFCFGTTHFCNACHDDFQRMTSVPKEELPHCPAGSVDSIPLEKLNYPEDQMQNCWTIYIHMTCYFYSFYHRAKRQAAGGNRVPLTRGSPTNGGGVCSGLWGVQECPHLLNDKTLTENQFVYCDFCLWLKPTCEAQLLHGQVSWTLDQVSALRQESSESSGLLLCCWHQYQGSAKDPGWGSFGYRVAWMKKNNRI